MELLHTKNEINDLCQLSSFILVLTNEIQIYQECLEKSKFQFDLEYINQQIKKYEEMIQTELDKYKIYLNKRIIKMPSEFRYCNYHTEKEGTIKEILKFNSLGVKVRVVFNDNSICREDLIELKEI